MNLKNHPPINLRLIVCDYYSRAGATFSAVHSSRQNNYAAAALPCWLHFKHILPLSACRFQAECGRIRVKWRSAVAA